ncbi:hypothetical protein sos41_35060 [Alphaproteobacteria bacterium SO-S41]|nr:hypothetical protein sos41_35060 [Alphaproteobacteria bacterium SO-S41]
MEDDARAWYRRPGWIVSALLHAGVVVLTFISFAPTYEPPVMEEFVPVSMLPIAETTNVKAAAKSDDPKPEPKPAAKPDPKPKTAPKVAEPTPEPTPPKPEPKPPEPKPEPPKPDPPKPEPAPPKEEPPPAPAPVAEAEPEPQPSPTPTPRAKPKEVKEPPKEVAEAKPDEPKPEKKPDKKPEKKPDEPKPEKKPEEPEPFDIDAAIAGVEDKENDDDPVEKGPETPPADSKPQKGKGDPTRATAAIEDAFKTQVSRCWSPPVGAPSPEQLIVDIRIKLNRDGSLNGMPQFVDSSKLSDPYYRAAAEAGRRAIMQCQNYDLPADSYEQWADLIISFDPSKMIGL